VTEVNEWIRTQGCCGEMSPDGKWVCLRPIAEGEHRHHWDEPELSWEEIEERLPMLAGSQQRALAVAMEALAEIVETGDSGERAERALTDIAAILDETAA
jgi:hypothetical protein